LGSISAVETSQPLRVAVTRVGRWAPPALADESTQPLRDAGADHVASTLAQTREYIGSLEEIPRIPVPAAVLA